MNINKKGFTLYELILSMAMFLLVVVLVMTFISFMNSYIQQNEILMERTKQINKARQELDYWLSVYDTDEYEITYNYSGGTVLQAKSNKTGEKYLVTFELVPIINSDSEEAIFERKLTFYYPAGGYLHGEDSYVFVDGEEKLIRRVVLDADSIKQITITRYNGVATHISGDKAYLRFLVNLPVQDMLLAVDVFY